MIIRKHLQFDAGFFLCNFTSIKMFLDKNNSVSFDVSPTDLNLEIDLKRNEVKYQNHSNRFLCLKKDFKKQFAHIYAGRLKIMKQRTIQACSAKWGKKFCI